MQRANSLEKTPMLGKIEGKGGAKRGKRRDGQIASPTQWSWTWQTQEDRVHRRLECYSPQDSQRVKHNLATEQQ